jgi:hypothetical protein
MTATFFQLNPSATTGFFIGQDNTSPNQVHLMQCPLAGGGCGPLGAAIESPGTPGYQTAGLVVTDGYAFWTYNNPASINSYAFATNAVTTLKTAFNSNLAVDGKNLYYSGSPLYTIYSLPLSFTGASVPQKVANSAAHIASLASDGVNVYFGTTSINGVATLSYVPIGGGTPTVLYTSPNATGSEEGSVVVAGGAIFWADGNLGSCPETYSIMGIAAP